MPHDGRPITYIKAVVHHRPEGETRSDAHLHDIIYPDGGMYAERRHGLFEVLWHFPTGRNAWVAARPKQQRECRSIVAESDAKRRTWSARWMKKFGKLPW